MRDQESQYAFEANHNDQVRQPNVNQANNNSRELFSLSDDDIATEVKLSHSTERSKLLEERNCSGQVPLMYIY